ncbi:MAG: hypothetical protein JNM10_14285 [Planctomycetia bacterium]|nr:hypothetical protein [Planctomycetia bacterium]
MRRPAALLAVVAAAAITVVLILWSRRDGGGDEPGVPTSDDVADGNGARTAAPTAIDPRAARSDPTATGPTPRDPAVGGRDAAAGRWIVSGIVVVAGSGAPLAGARLELDAARHPETLGSTEGSGPAGLAYPNTDGTGNFRLALDAGAPTTMTIRHPDARTGVLTIDGSALDLRVALDAGQRVRGRVVSRGGKALEGATVSVGVGPEATTVEVDREGRFAVRVDGRAPGRLVVSHPTHVTRQVPLVNPSEDERTVELTPALVVWMRLRTSDRVRADRAHLWWTSAGRSGQEVLALDGPPTRPAPDDPATVGPVEVPLDAAGTAVALRLTVPGYLPWSEELAPARPDGEERVVEAILERDPQAGAVAISLEGPDGRPRAAPTDAIVAVERADGGPAPGFARSTDAAGAVVVDGLPAGAYRVRVWLADAGPADAEVEIVAGTTVGARARATDEARLRIRVTGTGGRKALVRILSAGRAAQPRIVEDPTGKARLERVAVSGVPSVVVVVGEEGVTFGGLPGGPHRVEVVSPDVAATPVELELKPGETGSAEVVGAIR